MNKLILLLVLALCLSCNSKKEGEKTQTIEFESIKDSLRAELNEIHKEGHINGFAVAIVNGDGTLYSQGIGLADIETNLPYTTNTIQNIGSVSKTFIGISLLKAQEQGKLQLDDPVNNYLPFEVRNPHYPDAPITIRHLATHTSGILDTDYYDLKSYMLKDDPAEGTTDLDVGETFNSPEEHISLMEFLRKMLSVDGEWYAEEGFTKNKPGDIFEYTNVGATLAAAVLEVAVETDFNTYSTEHVLKPLHMSSSGWSFDNIDLSMHSKLYANPSTELPFYYLITYPDGGLIASVDDMGKYLSELIRAFFGEGTLLEKESYQLLFTEQLNAENLPDRDEENDYDDEYNSGIFMGFTPRGYVGHTGGDPGISTLMFFDPKTKTGKILMINTSIINEEGFNEFVSIWNTLDKYECLLNANKENPDQ